MINLYFFCSFIMQESRQTIFKKTERLAKKTAKWICGHKSSKSCHPTNAAYVTKFFILLSFNNTSISKNRN